MVSFTFYHIKITRVKLSDLEFDLNIATVCQMLLVFTC